MSRFLNRIRKAKEAQAQAAQAAGASAPQGGPGGSESSLVPEQTAPPSPPENVSPAPPTAPLFPDVPNSEVEREQTEEPAPQTVEEFFPAGEDFPIAEKIAPAFSAEPLFPDLPSKEGKAKPPEGVSAQAAPRFAFPAQGLFPDPQKKEAAGAASTSSHEEPKDTHDGNGTSAKEEEPLFPFDEPGLARERVAEISREDTVRPWSPLAKSDEPSANLVPSELGEDNYEPPIRKIIEETVNASIREEPALIPEDFEPQQKPIPSTLPESARDEIEPIAPNLSVEDHYLPGLTDSSLEETLQRLIPSSEKMVEGEQVLETASGEIERTLAEERGDELEAEVPEPFKFHDVTPLFSLPEESSESSVEPDRSIEEATEPEMNEAEVPCEEELVMAGNGKEESEMVVALGAPARASREPLYPSELETKTFLGDEPNELGEEKLFIEKTGAVETRVPEVKREVKKKRDLPPPPMIQADPEYVRRIRTIALRPDKRIISYHSPADHVCEEYRLLGKNLQHTFAEGPPSKRGRVVALTSAVRGEGKTLTSVNLAMTLAQDLMDRVLLIDGDLRHPRVHRYLGIPTGTGFNDLLASPDPISNLEDCLVRTETGLHLLLCTAVGKSPSPLLESRQMNQILQIVRDRYSIIIIDTPPVLLATDALTLGVKSDGMLFLMRARKTQREQVQEARQRIARLDIRLMGYVINNVKTFLPRIWSRYYYGNY